MWGERFAPRILPGGSMSSGVIDRDVTIPGVGVWHPRMRWLEGNAAGMAGLNIQQLVKRLTIRVHKPENLQDALKGPKISELEAATVDYMKGFSLHNLRVALSTANFNPEKLKLFRVIGQVEGIARWQIEEYHKLYRCLSGAKLEICGQTAEGAFPRRDDIVIRAENFGLEQWYRLRGCEVATDSQSLPWFHKEINDHRPCELSVDCDDQFLLMDWLPKTVQILRLYNVGTTFSVFCEFLRALQLPKLKEFRMTSTDYELNFNRINVIRQWFGRLVNLKGVGLWINGVRL
jgi:hypothetical protein